MMRRGFGGDLADLLDEMTGYPDEDDPRWALRELGLDLALDDITTIMSALSVDPDMVAPVAPVPVAGYRTAAPGGPARAPRQLVRPWSFLSCPMRRRLRLMGLARSPISGPLGPAAGGCLVDRSRMPFPVPALIPAMNGVRRRVIQLRKTTTGAGNC